MSDKLYHSLSSGGSILLLVFLVFNKQLPSWELIITVLIAGLLFLIVAAFIGSEEMKNYIENNRIFRSLSKSEIRFITSYLQQLNPEENYTFKILFNKLNNKLKDFNDISITRTKLDRLLRLMNDGQVLISNQSENRFTLYNEWRNRWEKVSSISQSPLLILKILIVLDFVLVHCTKLLFTNSSKC